MGPAKHPIEAIESDAAWTTLLQSAAGVRLQIEYHVSITVPVLMDGYGYEGLMMMLLKMLLMGAAVDGYLTMV